MRDIVLGYDPIEAYFKNTNTYFGATVGRSANRLAGARFTLNENQFQIPQNEGENNLHSGISTATKSGYGMLLVIKNLIVLSALC
ncbi:hypothetical protein ABG808_07915 [Streptococcus iniae]